MNMYDKISHIVGILAGLVFMGFGFLMIKMVDLNTGLSWTFGSAVLVSLYVVEMIRNWNNPHYGKCD